MTTPDPNVNGTANVAAKSDHSHGTWLNGKLVSAPIVASGSAFNGIIQGAAHATSVFSNLVWTSGPPVMNLSSPTILIELGDEPESAAATVDSEWIRNEILKEVKGFAGKRTPQVVASLMSLIERAAERVEFPAYECITCESTSCFHLHGASGGHCHSNGHMMPKGEHANCSGRITAGIACVCSCHAVDDQAWERVSEGLQQLVQ